MIGATRAIRLKKSWAEPAMTWTVVVGESGTLKTPPYKRAIAPVVALQAAALKAHRAALEQYRADLREYERAKRRAKDADPGDPPVEPPCTRIYARDTTVEALAGLLTHNRTRFLVGRDELNGWLTSFNQYKAKGGADQSNWLELHGLGTLVVDRKTGDPRTIFVDGVGVSLCGGIQPGVLKAALSPQHFSAGIPARLLFAYPPRRPKEWTEDDVDEAAEQGYHHLIRALAGLQPHTDADGDPYPVTLGLTPDARAAWVAFYARFADRQAGADGDLAAFSKLEGYAARLALVHQVCQSVGAGEAALEPVGVASIRAGIELAEWFTYEAERVYRMLGEKAEDEEVRKRLESVTQLAAGSDGRVSARQLQRSNSRKYRSADEAVAALESLVGQGLGQWEDGPTGDRGGHRVRYFVPCSAHDTSDTRDPDEGGGEPDTCPVPPPGPFQPQSGATTEPPAPKGRSGEATGSGMGQVSEVSCVGREVARRAVAPEMGRGQVSECGTGSDPGIAPGAGYTLVAAPAGLGDVIAAVEDSGGPVGVDVETTGLDPAVDRVRLLQLATARGTYVVELFALADPAAALAPLFDVLTAVEVVGHNLLFDLRFLARLGLVPGNVYDTLLASRVLHAGARGPNHARLGHGLEDVVARELGRELDKTHQRADWAGPVTPAMLAYAAADAEILLPLVEALKARTAAAGLAPTVAVENRALPGIAGAGPVTVDRPAWLALAAAAEAEADRLDEEMTALVPNPADLFARWNWNSPDQVQAAFATLGITLAGTDDATLAGVDHPLAGRVRDYRGAVKRAGTYGRAWVDKHLDADDRVRPAWNPVGAYSGRMSCADPNLQQVPRGSDYRRCFVARPGHVLVKADYSQVELRIAAKVADERVMIGAYREGKDLHALTAAAILGKPADQVAKADRQLAKAVNFGLLYGMGWRGLQGYARAQYGADLTAPQARGYRDAFFRAYPGLRAWHQRVQDELTRLLRRDPDGRYETRTLGGRRCVLAAAKRRADGTVYPNLSEALNFPVQGTGADGLKAAIARLWETRHVCPAAVPVLFCHDEIVLDVPAADAGPAADWLRRCMVEAIAGLLDPVPVEVEVSVGRTWGG